MTLIIAEAGVNHNGDKALAYKLIDAAHEAGADVVKFQTFKAVNLAARDAEMATYQITNSKKVEPQIEMLKRLELPYEFHFELMDYCHSLGIEFLSTAFDSESLSFLVNDLGLKRLKIPSGELTNSPLVLEHARSGCDLILSTGMASLADIELALSVIAFGLTAELNAAPSLEAFQRAYASEAGQKLLSEKVVLLHCTTEYPAPLESINLRAMQTIANGFGLPCGYSDHSAGINVSIAASALGAAIIEKHFTLDKEMDGPDHKASLEPGELKELISAVRDVELALGHRLKFPTAPEIPNMPIARKSLVFSKAVSKGDVITEKVLTTKRPGHGIPPSRYWEFLGKTVTRSYAEGDLVEES